MAFTILSTSGAIETLTFDYNETSAKQATYYAGLKRDTDNAINVITTSLVPDTSIAYENGSGWCSATLGTTESNTGKPINVSCSSNTGSASRACKIYLKYDNKTTSGYIYVSQNAITYNRISVRFIFQNGDYFTTNNVGIATSSNMALVVDGFWTLNTNTDEYSATMNHSYYASTAISSQKWVTIKNYSSGASTPPTKDVPTTYNWNSVTVCKSASEKTIGPYLHVAASNYTGGSLGTFNPISIPKSAFEVSASNYYYVTILIKPGGSSGSPAPTYEIIPGFY